MKGMVNDVELKVATEIRKGNEKKLCRKVKIIGLGNATFWAFIGFVSGYLLAAVVAAPHWVN